MTQTIRQSTQVVVRIGPFVDFLDGVTPETGITLGAADQAEALKAGGAATTDISAATWAAITGADGWYNLTLTTSHTDTVGTLDIVVQDASVCLPVFTRFQVIEEAAYDSFYAASADPKADINVASIDANAITATAIAADAITAAKIADGAIDAATFAAGAINAAAIATGAIDADALAADAAAEIADAIWDEARSGHVTAGSFGEGIASVQGNVTGSVGSVTGAVGSVTGNVGGNVAGSVASVTAAVTVGTINANVVNASALAADAVTEIQAGLSTLDAAGVRAAVGLATANLDTQLTAIDDAVDTEVAAVLAAVDTEVGAIKAKTDQLTFTVANVLDANVQNVNDVPITGNGSTQPFNV